MTLASTLPLLILPASGHRRGGLALSRYQTEEGFCLVSDLMSDCLHSARTRSGGSAGEIFQATWSTSLSISRRRSFMLESKPNTQGFSPKSAASRSQRDASWYIPTSSLQRRVEAIDRQPLPPILAGSEVVRM